MRERIVSSIKGKRRDGWEGLGSPTVPACLSDQDVEVLAARSWQRRGGGRLGEHLDERLIGLVGLFHRGEGLLLGRRSGAEGERRLGNAGNVHG